MKLPLNVRAHLCFSRLTNSRMPSVMASQCASDGPARPESNQKTKSSQAVPLRGFQYCLAVTLDNNSMLLSHSHSVRYTDFNMALLPGCGLR